MTETSQTLIDRMPPDQAKQVITRLLKTRWRDSYIKYWRPFEKQTPVFRAWGAETKILGVLGGNRSGKTEIGSFIAVAWALGKDYFKGEPAWEFVKDLPIPDPPNNIWIVGLDFPTLRDVIWREKLQQGREHPQLLPRGDKTVIKVSDNDYQVFFANGSVISGKSADSGREKFQGASVDLVWIDEEPEAEIFDECYQRTIDCRGKLLLTLTPLNDINSGVRTPWVFDLYEKWRQGQKDLHFVQLSVLDNPYVPEEEKVKLREKWAGHFEERARLYGEFVQRAGLVYPMWDPKKHIVKPFIIPDYWKRIVSIDPASTGVTAALWVAIRPGDNNLYFYREYYKRDAVISEHAKSILMRCAGDPIDIWLLDPQWGRQKSQETHKTNARIYIESGIPVRLPEVGDDYGVNESREYLNATITPNSRHPKAYFFDGQLPAFEDEMSRYSWDFFQRGPLKGMSKDSPKKGRDHAMNAFQYVCAIRPSGGRRVDSSPEDLRQAVQLNSYT